MPRLRPPLPHRLRPWSVGIAALVAAGTAAHPVLAQALDTGRSGEVSLPPALHGAGLEQFPPDRLFRVLGKDVLSATGESMGRIVDVLFADSGKPCAAVIDFGGFLGVGTRKIAIDWNALRFDLGDKKNVIALDLGREQLKEAPEYKESDKPVSVVTLPRPGEGEGASGSSR